jgi:hypothetical protein
MYTLYSLAYPTQTIFCFFKVAVMENPQGHLIWWVEERTTHMCGVVTHNHEPTSVSST